VRAWERSKTRDFTIATLAVLVATVLTWSVRPLRDHGAFLLFLAAVVFTTYIAGRKAAVWAMVLSTIAAGFFLVFPSVPITEIDAVDKGSRLLLFVIVSLMLIYLHASRSWAQRDARVKEQQLSLLMDAAHVGVWSYDLTTHEFWWSDSLKTTAGLDVRDDTPPYLGILDVCHPEDKGLLSRAMTEPQVQGKDLSFEHRIIRRSDDRAVRRLHTIARTFVDDEGKPERVTAITVDVTEHRGMVVSGSSAVSSDL